MEVSTQEQEILPNATERRIINQEFQASGHNSPPEPSFECGLYPINSIQPDPGSSGNASFTGWPCAEPPPQFTEAASLWDPFHFWPLENAFGYSDVASTETPGLYVPSGAAGTLNQQMSMSLGSSASVELLNFQQAHSRRVEEVNEPSSNAHLDSYVSETTLTEDHDILISEDYGHIPKPSVATYERVMAYYAEVSRSSSEGPLQSPYSLDILHVCTELYFEHFHQSFPVLHQRTFEARSSSPLLYIAVAAVGSQYSRLSNRTQIFFDLVKVIRLSLLREVCLV